MFEYFTDGWNQMPRLLRIATGANIILGTTIDYFGNELSREQMWNTKIALALFFAGPLMVAIGVGLLRRARWVRPALVVMPVIQLLPFLFVHVLFGGPNPLPEPMLYLTECVVWTLFALIYLFVSSQGKQFFVKI